jgi:hypothetical protein
MLFLGETETFDLIRKHFFANDLENDLQGQTDFQGHKCAITLANLAQVIQVSMSNLQCLLLIYALCSMILIFITGK